MKIGSLIIRSIILFSLAAPTAYSQMLRSCPDGQAIQGFSAGSLVCAPILAPAALNAEIAARQAADQTLQNSIHSGDAAAVLDAKNYTDARFTEAGLIKVVTINCSAGSSIGGAIAAEGGKQSLELRIQGNCPEHVLIKRDDITLQGDGGGATITGSVTIDTGRRAAIVDLTVTNAAGDGVTVVNGGSATVRGSHIVDNGGYGVTVRNGSFARVEESFLSRNGGPGTQVSGLFVVSGSMALGLRNTMAGNTNAGIEVGENSTYRSEGDIVTSSPNGRVTLDVFRASLAELRGVTATGNVDVNQQSQFQARNVAGFVGSTINGNINVGALSFMRLRTGVMHTGNKPCGIGPGFFTNPGNFSVCQIDP
jgi:Right handed beta helix region